MKHVIRGIIIGIVLIAIGAGIIITVLALNDWSIKQNFSVNTYTAEYDNSEISLHIDAFKLKTEYYDGDRIEITYPESKTMKVKISEDNGKLTFDSDIKWYASFFSFWGAFDSAPETVVKLPRDSVYKLSADLSAGEMNLAAGRFTSVDIDISAGSLNWSGIDCEDINIDISAGTVNMLNVNSKKLDVDISAGTVKIDALTCPGISADVSAGSIKIGVIGLESEYTIKSSVSAGSCNLTNRTGTTDKTLTAHVSAGSVTVSFSG